MSNPEDETARLALAIAKALAAAGPGEKAETRRMSDRGCAFFWRQVARLDIGPASEARWLLFTRLVALMTPAGRDSTIHDPGLSLGAALAEAGLSEQRFARLLAARSHARDDALERAIRMAARKVRGLNVIDLAWFILGADSTNRTARSYYQKLDRIKAEEPAHV